MKIPFAILLIFSGLQLRAQKFIELNDQFVKLFQKEEYQQAVPIGIQAIAQCRKEYREKNINFAIANQNLAEAYYRLDQLPNAFPYYKTALNVYRLYANSNAADIAVCTNSLGNIYFNQKKYDSAAFFYEQSFSYYINHPKDNLESVLAVMNNLTDLYLPSGKNKEAESVYERALPIIEASEGRQSKDYYVTLNNLGLTYQFQQLSAKAEKAFIEVAQIIKKLKGENNLEYATLLDQLVSAVLEQGRPKEAEAISLQSYQIKRGLPETDTISLVSSFNNFGKVYTELAEYEKALSFFKQAIDLLEKSNAKNTDWYEVTLRNYGTHYVQRGMPNESKKIFNDLLAILKNKYGDDYPDIGEILFMIANAEFSLNEFDSSEKHAKESMNLITRLYGNEHYIIAKDMETLGLVYHKLGRSAEAVQLFKKAIEINKKIFGPESDHMAYSLSDLGIIYQETGDFAQAEIVLKESLRIRKKLYGNEHPDYAMSLVNLSEVYILEGRYEQADPILAEAVQIYVKKGLTNTNNFLLLINNIAMMSDQQGRYEESKQLYTRVLEILQSNPDKNYVTLFVVLNNLGQNSLHQKKYDEAINYAQSALELAKKFYGTNTQDYVKALNNLFTFYTEKRELEKANAMAPELISLCKKVMGEKAQILGTIYFNASILEERMQNYTLASRYIDSFSIIALNAYRENFYTLSEKEKLIWWQEQSSRFYLAPSYLISHPSLSPLEKENFTNQQLQLKGFVLNDASTALKSVRQSGNIQLKKLIEEWQSNRALIAKESALPVGERTASIDSLEAITNELEKEINLQSEGVLKQKEEITNWKTIQAALAGDEAAVEFIRFRYFNKDWTDTMQYAAVIIRKNASPQFVSLCDEKQISYCLSGAKDNDRETNVNRLYRSTISGNKNNGKFLGDSLYKLIWEPLLPYLQNINTVSYAPDGLLHKIAFHALPTPDKKLLIDQYSLQQYTSIRQLTNRGETKITNWTSAFLLGNADFNSAPGSKVSGTSENAAFNSLPGTGKEVTRLQQVFTGKGVKVTMVSSIFATEEACKKLDGHSPAIMHLATHGFFLPDLTEDSVKKNLVKNSFSLSADPLMRSGIAVAGANYAWSGKQPPPGVEDGVLTAYEIAQLDLHQTQLVVLSACETALGDLQGSEGVFGLQRAFKIAGVKNMMVSLWQVPDKETVELMSAFYTNLLSGKPVREAFYLAQKEMRSKYTPFFWAAFVLVE